jgi:hypothetical protein
MDDEERGLIHRLRAHSWILLMMKEKNDAFRKSEKYHLIEPDAIINKFFLNKIERIP